MLPDGRVDPRNNCTAAVRPGVLVRNKAGTSAPLSLASPALTGDFGLAEAPLLVGIFGDDPDFGDATVAFGDRVRLTFDRATSRGSAAVGGPHAVGASVPRAVVDGLFNFSAPVGADYVGSWLDDSVFVLTVTDGAGSRLQEELGGVMVNPLGTVHNQGCRPGVTDRAGREGQCHGATAYAGPVVARDAGGPGTSVAGAFTAQFGVRPSIVLVEVDDPDNGDAVYGEVRALPCGPPSPRPYT